MKVLAVTVLVVAAASCRSKPGTQSPTVTGETWAVVDGRQITRDQVEKAFRRAADASQPISDEESLTAKLNLLDELILQDILVAKAAQLKIQIPDADLDKAYGEAKKNMTDDTFNQELKKRQLTPADMREGLRREMLARKVVEQEVESKIAVSDQEITDFFNANRAQFNVAEESYRVAQIIVTPVRDQQIANRTGDDATTPQAAEAKVRMIVEKLKAGASFREVAADYSEDPETAPRGGDLGFVPISRLQQAPPQLRNVVVGKAPGSVNVVTAGGAHTIVAVVAHEQAGQRDLSMPAVRESITATLRGRREQLLRTAYLTAARAEADVENYLARRLVESQGKVPNLVTSPGAK